MRILMTWFPVVMILLTAGHANEHGDEEGNPVLPLPPQHVSASKRYQISGKTHYPADVPKVLDLASALTLALRNNPALAACSSEVLARDAAVMQAGVLPNPELYGEIDTYSGKNGLHSFDESEIAAGFSQLMEFGGKRGKRRAVAKHDKKLAEWDYQIMRLDILASTSKAFIHVLVAQEQVTLNAELFEVAQKTASAVSEKVEAGKISPIENSRALVELATARTDVAKASRELEAARLQLAVFWGADCAQFSTVAGDLRGIIELPSEDSLKAFLSENPDIARRSVEIKRSKASLSTARAQVFPDLTVSAGVRSFRETGDNAFSAGVSVPIPLFNRNQGEIREAQARLDKSDLEQIAAKTAISTALSVTVQQFATAYADVVSLRDEILPAATTTYESTEIGYREGKFDLLTMLDAQRTLFTIRNRYLASLAAYHLAAIEIQRITGVPLNDMAKKNSYSTESEEQ